MSYYKQYTHTRKMTTISICVPSVRLYSGMDYDFVKQVFEKKYGEGSVESIDFRPRMKNGTMLYMMYTLFVHMDCKCSSVAMSMQEHLNNGSHVLLEVVFEVFHNGVNVVKKHVWKCVKSRLPKPPPISAKNQLAYAKAREWSNQLYKKQCLREEKRGIEEIFLLLPAPRNLEKLEQLLSETAKYAELCKGALTNAIALAKAKAEPSGDLWEYDLSNSNKRAVLENRLKWLMINNKSLLKTLYSAAEQMKYIKSLQQSITSQAMLE